MAKLPLLIGCFIYLIHVSTASKEDKTCTSFAECCSLCSSDSIRCARGPCSTNFLPQTFFAMSMPTEQVGLWDVVFSFYGMVPYLFPLVLVVAFVVLKHKCRTSIVLLMFCFIPIWSVVNSIIVMSLGDCDECHRPCGSCNSSNGLPSGHSSNSIGVCTWLILEQICGFAHTQNSPWRKRILAIGASVLLFVPVPYSRVYLGDHTELQVLLGSGLGVLYGTLYFLIFKFCLGKHFYKLETSSCLLKCNLQIKDTYAMKNGNSEPVSGSPNQGFVKMESQLVD